MLAPRRFFPSPLGWLPPLTIRSSTRWQSSLAPKPGPNITLEGMALALEGRFEPFSQGRGSITPERVEEMETIARRHGIYLAPLYNADGPVEDGFHCRTEGSRG